MKIDPADLLLRLTGDLSDLRGRVETLEGVDQTSTVNEIKETLAGIVETVKELQDQGEDDDTETGPGTAPDWTKVDQEQARVLWDWLLDRCGKIVHPVYALEVWRPCWYRHQRLRIELTWLCAYWDWSLEPKAPPTRQGEWHARWWPHVEKVMKHELRNCGFVSDSLREPKHVVPQDRYLDDFDDGELLAIVEKDIARRPAPQPKEKKSRKASAPAD